MEERLRLGSHTGYMQHRSCRARGSSGPLSCFRMNGFKSWLFSGGWWFLAGGLWLFTWLLGFTNGNASSSVWMLPVAVMCLILGFGFTQAAQQKRQNRG